MQRTQPKNRATKLRGPAAPAPEASLWPGIGFKPHLAVVIGLGVVVLLAFSNTLHNTGFALDNKFIILEDPRLRDACADANPRDREQLEQCQAKNRENIRLIFTEDYWWPKAVSGLYRPLTTLSYRFNYAILGNREHAAGYHWVNLLVHWLNASLLYFMTLTLLKKLWPAIFVAALFATHPIVTESVTNLVGRSDLFATAAIVGGFLCYAKSTTCSGWRKTPWLLLLMVITGLGVFFKESAVMVLGVMVLYDFTFRLQPIRTHYLPNLVANFWRFFIQGYVAVVPPLVAVVAVRAWAFGQMRPAEWPFVDNPLVSVATWIGGNYYNSSPICTLTAIKVIGKYFGLLLWPQKLSCDYSYDQVPLVDLGFKRFEDWEAILALVVVAGAIVFAVRQYRRQKPVFFFSMFFFLTLLPTSNLIVVTGAVMAERFLYLPSIGFAACVVMAVFAICQRTHPSQGTDGGSGMLAPPAMAGTVLGLMVLACGARTFHRNVDWEDDVQLWTQAVQVCPASFKTHKSLAYALYERDQQKNPPEFPDIDRIIEEGEKALEVMEKRALPALHRASIVYLHLGAYYQIKANLLAQTSANAARPWYQKSADILQIAVVSDHAFNDDNRRKELVRGRAPDKIADVGNDQIYMNLGLVYMRLGQYDKALDAYTYMRHLAPTNPDAYLNIASTYLTMGRVIEAAVALMQVLIVDSNRKEPLQPLLDIYRQIDHQGCAVISPEGQPLLNADCPLVHDHICAAEAGLVHIFTEAKQFDLAARMAQNAREKYHCPLELLQQPTANH
jgi:protein O-mannosyl-transferase